MGIAMDDMFLVDQLRDRLKRKEEEIAKLKEQQPDPGNWRSEWRQAQIKLKELDRQKEDALRQLGAAHEAAKLANKKAQEMEADMRDAVAEKERKESQIKTLMTQVMDAHEALSKERAACAKAEDKAEGWKKAYHRVTRQWEKERGDAAMWAARYRELDEKFSKEREAWLKEEKDYRLSIAEREGEIDRLRKEPVPPPPPPAWPGKRTMRAKLESALYDWKDAGGDTRRVTDALAEFVDARLGLGK